MTDVEKGITKTLVYFDNFNFPLTSFELWRFFYGPKVSFSEIEASLSQSSVLSQLVEFDRGFYFLQGRRALIQKRLERYQIAAKKFRRVRRVSRILALIPFIRLIAVCNSLGSSNASSESDLDLFIITERGRIWQARFWSILILEVLGLRPKPQNTRDKICLSFFISEDHLNLKSLTLKPSDPYFYYWLNQLVPIYEVGETSSKFFSANNWVKEILANSFGYERVVGRRRVELGWLARGFKRVGELIFGLVPERVFKKIQLKVMSANLKELVNRDSRVVVTNQVLKFHANDRREQFAQAFRAHLVELGLGD